ncbi:MAG: sensor domain-containing diguanylate cyclase [Treponema sp.]|jgi:diguanylate cyclase (GGDEF)-like protein|nr:sensor domain-containing diguanylate cyclase [Treponema sp.]
MENRQKKISINALIFFCLSLALCGFLINARILSITKIENLIMEQVIFEKSIQINEVISKLLYKTQSLSAIVIQGNGNNDHIMNSFDRIAPLLVDDPVIRNVLIAPDGIVAKVYPLETNENVIGLNFFSEGLGNREAVLAMEIGDLVMGGPFHTVQGDKAIVGRLPVYVDTETRKHKFWGIVSVTIKFPQVLEKLDFGMLNNHGFTYELWRISPDTNEREVIAGSPIKPAKSRFIEMPVRILNAEWHLKVSPDRMWYNYTENIVVLITAVFISFLVLFVMQHNHRLKKIRSDLELVAISDPLTGIFNRRHFMNIARLGIEKSRRHNEICNIIMLDIDRFKNINDTYGHTIGDKVLIEVTLRIKADIRPYDLFGRYGGEEFIIFISGTNNEKVYEITERLRLSLCSRKYEYGNVSLDASASFGIAHIADYDLEKAIEHADEALYTAKKEGRNRIVLYGGNPAV